MTGSDRDRNDGDVPRTVHDAIFKHLFSDPALAVQELQAVLSPALVACVDWSVMTLMPSSFVDAVFQQRTSDLVYQSRFLDDGGDVFWLFEHQSTEDWWMLKRVLDTKRMMWLLWLKQRPEVWHLPVIVPVVVYNGPRPWRVPRDMHALYGLSENLGAALGPHVLSCTLVIDDLRVVDDEALRSRDMDAQARLCLFAMARAADKDFLDSLAAWRLELSIMFKSGDVERIRAFLAYTSHVHRHADPGTVRKRIAALVGPEQETAVQTFYEMIVQEGFDKGLETGRAMLLRLLGRRFGAVPEPIAARVATATSPELERWSDRVLDAASLDEVLVGPEQETAVQTFYELVVQEGLEKGLERERAILLRLLGRRFGAVPEPIAARVAAATPTELERWFDRILDVASLDDVFASESPWPRLPPVSARFRDGTR